jgi:hypothetical protein
MKANSEELDRQRDLNEEQIARDTTAANRFETTYTQLEKDINKAETTLYLQRKTLDSLDTDIRLARRTLQAQNTLFEKQKETLLLSSRMSMPLRDVYYSFVLTYQKADIVFEDYYKKMEAICSNKHLYKPEIYQYLKFNPDKKEMTIYVKNPDIESRFLPIEEDLKLVQGNLSFHDVDQDRSLWMNPELNYGLLAWVHGYQIEKDPTETFSPHDPTRYAITIDFESRVLTQKVEKLSYQMTRDRYSMFSVADILYPDNPEKRYIVFSSVIRSEMKVYPQFSELEIFFGEYSSGIKLPEYWSKTSGPFISDMYKVNVKKLQEYFHRKGIDKRIPGHNFMTLD